MELDTSCTVFRIRVDIRRIRLMEKLDPNPDPNEILPATYIWETHAFTENTNGLDRALPIAREIVDPDPFFKLLDPDPD